MTPRQLPVYSPLSGQAVVEGLRAAVNGGEAVRRSVGAELRERFDAVDLMLTDSGTSALTLALRAVSGETPGRPVALPAFSCYDVATAAVGAEVQVSFYDLDPSTLGPDMDSLEDAVRRGAGAIVVAHLYGIPVNLPRVLDLAREACIPVVEDAAQAAGGESEGRPLGSFGSLSVLSFGRGKGTTGCGGGALLAHDGRGREWLNRSGRVLGEDHPRGWSTLPPLLGQWVFGRPGLYAIPASLPGLSLGETVYRDPEPAGPMTALSAGVLNETLALQEPELTARRDRAGRLKAMTGEIDMLSHVEPPESSAPGYLRFPVLASGRMATKLRSPVAESLGVMPGYPRPLHRLPAMEGCSVNRATPRRGAEELSDRLFTLPTHSRLDETAVARLTMLLETPVGGGADRETEALRSGPPSRRR